MGKKKKLKGWERAHAAMWADKPRWNAEQYLEWASSRLRALAVDGRLSTFDRLLSIRDSLADDPTGFFESPPVETAAETRASVISDVRHLADQLLGEWRRHIAGLASEHSLRKRARQLGWEESSPVGPPEDAQLEQALFDLFRALDANEAFSFWEDTPCVHMTLMSHLHEVLPEFLCWSRRQVRGDLDDELGRIRDLVECSVPQQLYALYGYVDGIRVHLSDTKRGQQPFRNEPNLLVVPREHLFILPTKVVIGRARFFRYEWCLDSGKILRVGNRDRWTDEMYDACERSRVSETVFEPIQVATGIVDYLQQLTQRRGLPL